jgi:hypothetical protein
MKHDPNTTANATAVTIGIVYVACRVLVLLMPNLFLAIARTWFHGIDIGKIAAVSNAANLGSFVLGLITSAGAGWAVGYLFAKTYNYFLKK